MLGPEVAGLQLDDHIAAQLQVVEEQVEVEVVAPHLEVHLAADEGEAGTEFQEQLAQVLQQAAVDVTLAGVLGQAEEVEVVGVLEQGHSQFGLRRWEGAVEVGGRAALAAVEIRIDLCVEYCAAPAVGNRGLRVPDSLRLFPNALKKSNIVTPGQLSDKLSDNCLVRPRLGKTPHTQQVSPPEAPESREFPPQVARQFLRRTRSPACRRLASKDLRPNLPVQEDEFAINLQGRAYTCGPHPVLDVR